MLIDPRDWYDNDPDLSHLYQGDVLEGVPVVFGPPKSKRWILLRPQPKGSPIESAESGPPKSFRADVDANFPTAWQKTDELVLARAWVGRIMIVSQSCDLDWRKHIQVAPVAEAEPDFSGDDLIHLLENDFGYLFSLPADPPHFPASYADLSRITSVDGSYFRPDALVRRLSSKGMMELQKSLSDFYGRPFGFNTQDTVPPHAAMYACASCFLQGRAPMKRTISNSGERFPPCPVCADKVLWVRVPNSVP
jgi:hypothetical protein